MNKTNVMRLLDAKNISYKKIFYKIEDKFVSGVDVARQIGKPKEQVFKTLVIEGDKDIYVAVIPVNKELDFKKISKLVGEKKVKMLDINKLFDKTGYLPGGCSPIAMKKNYLTILDKKSLEWEEIIISAGKIGGQIQIKRDILLERFDFILEDIVK